ncbi:MAG TPA: PH domain-containing protein [Gaiellaceae bacterium]|nr:PH domain-containing protein [Gaiellaceae bacterium]
MQGALAPGEEVRLESRPHGVALVGPLLRPLVLAGAGAALVVLGSPVAWPLGVLGALLLGLAAAAAFRAVWRWDRTRLVLTSEKLFVVYGIARRRAAAVRLSRVPALEWEQGPVGRALGYGTLVAGDFEVPYVPARGRELLG